MSRGFSPALLIAPAVQRVAERLLERTEPRLEVLPLIQSLAINRPANLFRTGRAHAALRLMELDALGFDLEAAVFKNAPPAALEIVDYVLVMHAQHPSGQYTVPVAHQLEIGSIVTRDVFDAVGELLAIGK